MQRKSECTDSHAHKRILFVINGTDFGGTESAVFETACGLKERGYGVHVLSLKPLGRTGFRLKDEGITVSSLEMAESVHVSHMISGCWKLAKWLRRHQFDVIHSLLPRANIMSRIAVLLSRLGTTHISSERSTDFKRSAAVRWLNYLTVSLTDYILAVSPIVGELLIKREHIPARKILILENGIDVKRLNRVPPSPIRKDMNLSSDSVLLCSVGRLVADKGHFYLIRAIAQMRRKGGVNLILVGEGPEEFRLRREAVECGLSDRVHFLGFRSDVPSILKSIDIFVLPSLEEGIPVVLLEAMACSLPIIATEVGGIPDLVIPGQTGLLVPPAEIWNAMDRNRDQSLNGRSGPDEPSSIKSISALATALDELVSNPDQIERLGQLGKKRLEQYYTQDRVLARLEYLYTHGRPDSHHDSSRQFGTRRHLD